MELPNGNAIIAVVLVVAHSDLITSELGLTAMHSDQRLAVARRAAPSAQLGPPQRVARVMPKEEREYLGITPTTTTGDANFQ